MVTQLLLPNLKPSWVSFMTLTTGIAVCVEPESVNALVCGIKRALMMPKVNTVARDYAERTLDKENVLSQFLADIRGT